MTKAELVDNYNEWLKIAKSFGATDTAEDIVQEMYVKLLDKTDLSKTYVWVTMRNIYINQFRNQLDTVELNIKIHNECDNNDTFAFINKENVLTAIEKEVNSWSYFYKKIFELSQQMSARQISRETGIGLRTICDTINDCKWILKTKIQWQQEEED